ncbi:hypothetical protein SAMN05421781_0458 [Marinococcus luteus]|uniref:Sporulation protein YhaL n=1 Tax=Marinococcus luteus TaxID=1122204 RepID=A0A1H2QTB2_9BACI|nr:hypothetical protein [Marinococcus luteus]SDW10412.1 hypothetical protein SAMN05421781_0458 [Marinococcus luteus]
MAVFMDLLIFGALLMIAFNMKALGERMNHANKEQLDERAYERLKAEIKEELKSEREH